MFMSKGYSPLRASLALGQDWIVGYIELVHPCQMWEWGQICSLIDWETFLVVNEAPNLAY